ncbi:protein SENSITIVITY TO RED LIGHT REDUCED 1-like [Cannabis sativa]|uniref:protein SENSITIVITY TO RED LIGHT REDUCED 1-like n=1 Tax=Cannabis sativa TaxID=3483 RepID=UPI0029C9BB83|nr:protein SENSITIVITY TO RED LIGHT REDUCED 1-like [Cannabis sativa]
MAIVGSRRRSGTTQQNANLPIVSANYKWKKWSYFVPLVVALAVMSDMAFVDRLHFFSQPPPANQEPTIQQLVQLSKNELNTMPFFVNFWDQIQNNEEISLRLENLVNSTDDSKIDMVIYCIGRIKESEHSRLQLSLALLLKEKVDWINNDNIKIFDPRLSDEENEALSEMGFQVLENNEGGRRKANEPTLFYMPHCPVTMYLGLMEENLEDTLNNVVILGNSFEKYKTDYDDSNNVDSLSGNFSREFQIVRNVVDILPLVQVAFKHLSWMFCSE